MNKKILRFPNNFLWGTATAAHQVEGGNKNNDWWDFEQKGNIQNKETSGISVDHYNRYEEDLDIAKSLHQNVHRFSIEWSRIEPREGVFDTAEIQHYQKVIKALKMRNMKVMVTLFHFTLPQWFAEQGGWENSRSVEKFLSFVEYVAAHLGNDVDFWVTINEPFLYASHGYLLGRFPPQKRSIFKFIRVLTRLIKAHKESFFTIHKHFKDAKVSFSTNTIFFEPFKKISFFDRAIVYLANFGVNKYFLNKVENYLDFIAIQYYCHSKLRFKLGGSYFKLAEEVGIEHSDGEYKTTDIGWEIYPEGIYHILMDLKKYDLPIIITENGIADSRDNLRADFIRDHLINIHRAIESGVNVCGYLHWTLMDNFEWIFGRKPCFGLVEIDYKDDLKRRIRPSAKYFAKICKENLLVVEK